MKPISVRGSFTQGGKWSRESGCRVSLPRNPLSFSIADGSLRTLHILKGDIIVCTKKPFYEDGQLVLCRTSDPSLSQISLDSRYYIGRYRQISELVTVLLPNGTILASNVLIIGLVSHVIRLFE
jgi:hypothetical protein